MADGATARSIANALADPLPLRTLQHRLARLVRSGRLVRTGEGPSVRYTLPPTGPRDATAMDQPAFSLSAAGRSVQLYVRRPEPARKPVGYNRGFLDTYRPNVTRGWPPTSP